MAGDPPLPDSWSLVYNEEHEILMNRKGETPMPSSFAQFAICAFLLLNDSIRLERIFRRLCRNAPSPPFCRRDGHLPRPDGGGEDPFLCRASFYKNYGSKDLRPRPSFFPRQGSWPSRRQVKSRSLLTARQSASCRERRQGL